MRVCLLENWCLAGAQPLQLLAREQRCAECQRRSECTLYYNICTNVLHVSGRLGIRRCATVRMLLR